MPKIRLEKDLRNWFIEKLRNYAIEFQPIESESTGIGIPDLYFSASINGWIELKCEATLYSSNSKTIIKIPFRPGQLNWINRHGAYNNNIYLALYYGKRLFILRYPNIQKEYYYENELIDKSVIDTAIEKVNIRELFLSLIQKESPPF